jgi:hypothetical protein
MTLLAADRRIDLAPVGLRIYSPGEMMPDGFIVPKSPLVYPAGDSRVRPVTAIVAHSTHGTAHGDLVSGIERDDSGQPIHSHDEREAEAYAAAFSDRNGRAASAHFVVAFDGAVIQVADIADRTWHACGSNYFTLGIEHDQHLDGRYNQDTLDAGLLLLDVLTYLTGVQRWIPMSRGAPDISHLARMSKGFEGRDVRGVWFHANRPERDSGDPGPAVPLTYLAAGYEGFDVAAREDLKTWAERQTALGFTGRDVDGLPGPQTRAAIVAAGTPSGQWITRPIDAQLAALGL